MIIQGWAAMFVVSLILMAALIVGTLVETAEEN